MGGKSKKEVKSVGRGEEAAKREEKEVEEAAKKKRGRGREATFEGVRIKKS